MRTRGAGQRGEANIIINNNNHNNSTESPSSISYHGSFGFRTTSLGSVSIKDMIRNSFTVTTTTIWNLPPDGNNDKHTATGKRGTTVDYIESLQCFKIELSTNNKRLIRNEDHCPDL